ncbi:pyridoxal phosphate-dependent aminotransferase [Hoeflea sp. YIM 152468]|uniref:pyridoxal phosphate-dependent aminotransferase n=1 Tax=Hoeflea sp. YIM 152468 TaxID=3031759 RepID=UPI0023DA78F1|nr:pyridoxal phosphate-dependent aminotransferase [Hoeflea sp. YIM 152468]MDF1606723.1 pyridoxal phosphate-dependent aminotransferase [Hoeflea sp. YIM 152468]
MHYAAITERLAHTGGAKWLIHQRCRTLKAAGADIIELTIGEPDQPPDPRLFEVCHQSMLAGRTGYSNGRGEPALLDAIAARYSRRRPGVDAGNVLCFPGTQTALFATMMGLTGPGDGVLVGDPFYATYDGVITASGAHRVSVQLRAENGFRLTADDLEAAITPQSRVLLLNSPHNPTGAVLSAAELEKIGHVCARHDLWIVADEVYEELVFDGNYASPFDNPDLAERVVAVSSISKSHAAPGFRSGWAVGPHQFCDKLLPLAETMLFGNQPFIADMTAFALTSNLPTAARMRDSYQRRAALFADTLGQLKGVVPYPPQAGMFIIADVSGTGLGGEEFAWQLLEAGVAVMPGSSFGDNAGKLIRLSLTVPDEAVVEACARIAKFVDSI